jgi:DNA-directed RNA polymerase subunit RPC12/RpoP
MSVLTSGIIYRVLEIGFRNASVGKNKSVAFSCPECSSKLFLNAVGRSRQTWYRIVALKESELKA